MRTQNMLSKLLRLVILGAPGSGKGTISERIIRDFDLKHLSSGDLLRTQLMNNTEFGVEAKKYMDQGKLLPDAMITKIISVELCKLQGSPWLLDGFPRTGVQAELLHKEHPINIAINLDVPIEVIVERIKGRWMHLPSGRIYNTDFNPPKRQGLDDVSGEPLVQRDDDKPEVVRNRLETYARTMDEVLQFYRSRKLLTEFHGTESNKIWPHVHKYLSQYITPRSGP